MLFVQQTAKRFETTLGSGRSQSITSPTTGDVDTVRRGLIRTGAATRMVVMEGLRPWHVPRSHYAPLPLSVQAYCHQGITPIIISGVQQGCVPDRLPDRRKLHLIVGRACRATNTRRRPCCL